MSITRRIQMVDDGAARRKIRLALAKFSDGDRAYSARQVNAVDRCNGVQFLALVEYDLRIATPAVTNARLVLDVRDGFVREVSLRIVVNEPSGQTFWRGVTSNDDLPIDVDKFTTTRSDMRGTVKKLLKTIDRATIDKFVAIATAACADILVEHGL